MQTLSRIIGAAILFYALVFPPCLLHGPMYLFATVSTNTLVFDVRCKACSSGWCSVLVLFHAALRLLQFMFGLVTSYHRRCSVHILLAFPIFEWFFFALLVACFIRFWRVCSQTCFMVIISWERPLHLKHWFYEDDIFSKKNICDALLPYVSFSFQNMLVLETIIDV